MPRAPGAIASRTDRAAVVVLVLALSGLGAGCGQRPSRSQPATGAAPKRQALAQQSEPIGARGRTLGLSRVVIPPGASLALHRHEGTQVAYVQQGALTYSVLSGGVGVMRGAPDAHATRVRRIGPGQTAQITPGEWIVEEPDDVHRAANRGRKPVVVLLATLLRTGAPPATPVARAAAR